jgi:hypothetical protein
MTNGFVVTLNNQIIHAYKDIPAPARLRRCFDEMDQTMGSGVQLGDAFVKQPSDFQRQQYIAMDLVHCIEKKDLQTVEVLSAYLVKRNTALIEINVISKDDMFSMKLITKE